MTEPLPELVWWHLILTCRGQWLHGDPRGFRSRDHRIHSSGDYKHRPPQGEHQGLFEYQRRHSAPPVTVPPQARPQLGEAILRKAVNIEMPCLCLAAGPTHTHLLAALANDWADVLKQMGRLKQAGSHAIGHILPGKVWAGGGKPIRIENKAHHQRVFRYILKHVHEGAWVWRFDGQGGDPALRFAQSGLLDAFLERRKHGNQ